MKFGALRSRNQFHALEDESLSSQSAYQDKTAAKLLATERVKGPRLDSNIAHERWGHCGEGMLHRTAKSNSIELFGTLRTCETCILTKSNQLSKEEIQQPTRE